LSKLFDEELTEEQQAAEGAPMYASLDTPSHSQEATKEAPTVAQSPEWCTVLDA